MHILQKDTNSILFFLTVIKFTYKILYINFIYGQPKNQKLDVCLQYYYMFDNLQISDIFKFPRIYSITGCNSFIYLFIYCKNDTHSNCMTVLSHFNNCVIFGGNETPSKYHVYPRPPLSFMVVTFCSSSGQQMLLNSRIRARITVNLRLICKLIKFHKSFQYYFGDIIISSARFFIRKFNFENFYTNITTSI